jgi:hypothetical protein
MLGKSSAKVEIYDFIVYLIGCTGTQYWYAYDADQGSNDDDDDDSDRIFGGM